MKKKIEVACPARLTLFLNESIVNGEIRNFRLINQTIDLYDKLEISEEKTKNNSIKITSSKKNLQQEKILLETCKLFFQFCKLSPNDINIFLEKNIPTGLGYNSTDSLIAGLLKSLNCYYNNILNKKELIFLAKNLGLEVPYFLEGGYVIIQNKNDHTQRLRNNPYHNYLIIKPNFNIDSNQIKNELEQAIYHEQPISKDLYNDYLRVVKSELKELHVFLNKYQDINYNLLATGPLYFVAFKEKVMTTNIKKELHKMFPDYKFSNVKNSEGHKILVKYNERLDI